MDRFQQFCELFADFPSVQNDLSLLDKPVKSCELETL
jgi:hypothetical protein